jgi:hypothetical protein
MEVGPRAVALGRCLPSHCVVRPCAPTSRTHRARAPDTSKPPGDQTVATTMPDAFSLSNGFWNEFHQAYQIINGPVRAALLGDAGSSGSLPLDWKSGYLRLVAWMHSITQLQSPSDFQAVFAAARAMLEITVDAVLLKHLNDAVAQMADWEESAKLKHAEAIIRFYAGRDVPAEFNEAVQFVEREGASVTAKRTARGWVTPTGTKHPDRWTSRNLGDDAKRADGFEPGLALEETYETKYRQMCWYVHASGAVGLRGLGADIFPALGGLTLRTCSTLAVVYAKLVLKYADVWAMPFRGNSWERIFAELKCAQAIVLHAAAFGVDATNELYLRWQRQSTSDLQTASVGAADPTDEDR